MGLEDQVLGESCALLDYWAWTRSRSLHELIFPTSDQEYRQEQNCYLRRRRDILLGAASRSIQLLKTLQNNTDPQQQITFLYKTLPQNRYQYRCHILNINPCSFLH